MSNWNIDSLQDCVGFADADPDLLNRLEAIQNGLSAACGTASGIFTAEEIAALSEACAPIATADLPLAESTAAFAALDQVSRLMSGTAMSRAPLQTRKPGKGRGRPSEISDERKERAAAVRANGGSLGDAAKILYDTQTPTRQQKSNASTILRVFRLKKASKAN